MMAFPLQVDYGEGPVLQWTDELSRGHPIYCDPASYPWHANPYAPLYIGVCALIRPLLGVGFAAGRLVSWLSALGAVLCVAWTAAAQWRDNRRRLAALCAAAFFLCSPLTVQWAGFNRVDFMGLFLELTALLCVDASLRRIAGSASTRRALLAAGPLFALAFFTKQTFVLGFLAAVGALFAARRITALRFFLWTVVCILIPFMVMNRNGWFFSSLFTNNVMVWSWPRAWHWLFPYSEMCALPLAATLTWIGVRGRGPLLWWFYLGLTALDLVGVGRLGADFNHFLPFQAALSMVAGMAVADMVLQSRRKVVWAGMAFLTVIQIAGLGFFAPLGDTFQPLSRVAERLLDGRLGIRIVKARTQLETDMRTLNEFPGAVVAENMGLPILAGRMPVLCDPSTLFAMAQSGKWDAAPFVAAVREHRFGVILLQRLDGSNARFPPAVVRDIQRHYVEVAMLGGDHLLVPRR